MSLRHIVSVSENNPTLTEKARRVRGIGPHIQSLIDDMVETMRAAPGVGLAAPQVGVPLRIVVIETPENEDEPGTGRLYTLINPEIVKASPELEEDQEGCLSIPGYAGYIKRHSAITVKALNRGGKEVRLKARGYLARVFQHELDHLDGVLFTDHLEGPDKLIKLEPEPGELSESNMVVA
jgi:peptide deformylase